MPFADWTEVAPEPLRLPYAGKVYEIPPVGIADAERLRAALDSDDDTTLPDGEYEALLLGAAGEAMRADGVPAAFYSRALATAIADFNTGRLFAEAMWATGGATTAVNAWIAEHLPKAEAEPAGSPADTDTITSPEEDQTTTT